MGSSLFQWLLLSQIVQAWIVGIVTAISYDPNDETGNIGLQNQLIDTTGPGVIGTGRLILLDRHPKNRTM